MCCAEGTAGRSLHGSERSVSVRRPARAKGRPSLLCDLRVHQSTFEGMYGLALSYISYRYLWQHEYARYS